jgi:hypothetical protein
MFSGKAMARDAGHFLKMCKDAEKVVYHQENRGGQPAGGCGRGMGNKRSKTTKAALGPPPLLSQATSAPAPGEGSGSELSPNFREYNDVIRSRDCFPEFSVCETVVCRRGSTCSGIGSDVRWCNYGLGFV